MRYLSFRSLIMRTIYFWGFCLLFSNIAFSIDVPDEINFRPYEEQYVMVSQKVSQHETQLLLTQKELQQKQDLINKYLEMLSSIENEIQVSKNQIDQYKMLIPQLAAQIVSLRNENVSLNTEMRSLKREEERLAFRYQVALKNLREVEEVVRRKEEKIQSIQAELSQFGRMARQLADEYRSLSQQLQLVQQNIRSEIDKQRQLENDLTRIQRDLSRLESQISDTQRDISRIEAQLNSEKQKLSALNSRVEDYRTEVSRLRASGASRNEIAAAERKLQAATQARDSQSSEIRSLENQLTSLNQKLRSDRSTIAQLKREQDQIPNRISESQRKQRQLETQFRSINADVERVQREIAQTENRIQRIEADISMARNDLKQDEVRLQENRNEVGFIIREIEANRRDLNSLVSRINANEKQELQLAAKKNEYELSIPRLETQIENAENEIGRVQQNLNNSRLEEVNLNKIIFNLKQKLEILKSEKDQIFAEFDRRKRLFNKYLAQSQALGEDQARDSENLGQVEGEKMAFKISNINGAGIGKELGEAEAKLWGHVRGETYGYAQGYKRGLESPEDRERGRIEGDSLGRQHAITYVQTKERPVIFEKILKEEINKPIVLNKLMGSMRSTYQLIQREERDFIDPISETEWEESLNLRTILDSSIENDAKMVRVAEKKSIEFLDPKLAYVKPNEIPFGRANCESVYKKLEIFRSACMETYKSKFMQSYLDASFVSFSSTYPSKYDSALKESQIYFRNSLFDKEFSWAEKISSEQGVKLGKEEIYQRSFSENYKISYDLELPKARQFVYGEAKNDLYLWLEKNPLLSITEARLDNDSVYSGKNIKVDLFIKNIGFSSLKAPSLIQISEVQNAFIKEGSLNIDQMDPRSTKKFSQLEVKVSEEAKAGEKILLRGVAYFPGDIYQPMREEKFTVEGVVSLNPMLDATLDYSKYPEIKGVFRRKIHYLKVSLKPRYEEINKAYKLTIRSDADSVNLINIKEETIMTGPLKMNQAKDFYFSYTFNDIAKNKNIKLELDFEFENSVLTKEIINLTPQ
jgi:septal ring factor EnvC (AmiA/AmiB activator)